MLQLSIQNVSQSFGGPLLLDNISFQVHKGEKISFIGRNGSGKSTLLKLIQADMKPESGLITRHNHITISTLPQEIPKDISGLIFDVVAIGLGKEGELLSRFHKVSTQMAIESNEKLEAELSDIQHAIDIAGGWDIEKKVDTILTRMKLNPDLEFATLSSGMKRRVLLAKSLVSKPDILLLDEPTNHLDINAIIWMENFFSTYSGTVIFVTHDRVFLRKLAERIIELDRGGIFDWSCNYETFISRKNALLENEATQNALFDKKMAKEEVWIRQGVKARRTRDEGRVRALIRMRELRKTRREQVGTAKIEIQEGDLSGKFVVDASDISHGYDEKTIIKNFSTTIIRGDKIGLIGPNGAGKTTLLNILLGNLTPNSGKVKLGTKLEVAYFDQLRDKLDDKKSVRQNISDGSDSVTVNGRSKHVIGYLQDFLFTPERAMTPVNRLSGGERNRLLLARLFAKPSNLLILDEPTNDLDEETLTLLEERLIDYSGTILVVSHDREFLNNVATSTIAFEGDGVVNEYIGGYDDWIRQSGSLQGVEVKIEKVQQKKNEKPEPPQLKSNNPRKLSFKELKELESIPPDIDKLEDEQKILYDSMGDPKLYKKEGKETIHSKERIIQIEKKLKELYDRWEILEKLRNC